MRREGVQEGAIVVAGLESTGGWMGGGSLASTKESVGIRLPSEAGVRLRRRRGGGIGC